MTNKKCLIIGAGPGMGLSLANRFSKEGFQINLMARNLQKLEALKKEMGNMGSSVGIYSCDVSNAESLSNALVKLLEDSGGIDLLIYNVSVLTPGKPSEIDLDSFEKDFRVNVKGLLIAYQLLLDSLSNRKGSIIVTGGGLALKPFYEFTSLGVGKAGIRNLTINLAQQGSKLDISVATITINGMIEKKSHFDPDKIAELFYKVYKEPVLGKVEYVYE